MLPGNVVLCVCVCLSIFAPRSFGSPEDVGQLYHHQSSAARSVAYKLTGRTSWSPYSLSRQRTSWITLAPSLSPNLSLSLSKEETIGTHENIIIVFPQISRSERLPHQQLVQYYYSRPSFIVIFFPTVT